MKLRIFLSFFLTVFSYSTVAVSEEASPETAGRFMVVLDASGSMWGQIDNTTKIEIARSVVGDLVKDWNPESEVGLVAYGHRRKGDCKDIEVVSALGKFDKAGFVKAVNDLTPKGMTPLSDAVVKAAETLKYTEQKATVILVSDGIETCDQDPCSVASKLESSGVDFTTHVIGFDVAKEQEKKQLRCLAENTGGTFFSADNAESLKGALESAVEEAAPKEPVTIAKKETGVRVATVFESGGEVFTDVRYEFLRLEDNKVYYAGRTGTDDDGAVRYKLDPGKYLVKVRSTQGKATTEREITITEDDIAREEFVLAMEGDAKFVAVNAPGEDPLEGVTWKILDENGKTVTFGKGPTPTYRLLPGTYRANVVSQKGKAEANKEFTIAAGAEDTIEVVMAKEGLLKLRAVVEAGGEPLNNIYWEVLEKPASALSDPKRVTFGKGSTPEYKLLPGEYIIRAKSQKGKAKHEQLATVTAGELNDLEVLFPAEGEIELVAVNVAGGDALDNIYFEVYEPAKSALDSPKRIGFGSGGAKNFRLLPGNYIVKAKSRKGKAEVEQDVTVEANNRIRTEVLLPAEGRIDLTAVYEDSSAKAEKVYWRVYDIPKLALNDPKEIDRSGSATPSFQLLPGKYRVSVKNNQTKEVVEKEIEVVAGEVLKDKLVFGSEKSSG